MMNWYNVEVNWISNEDGGRKKPLTGNCNYITTSRFQESDDEWLAEAWSVVVKFENELQGHTSIGKAKFLTDTDPSEKFKAGNRFDLYEGSKKVANVLILA